MMLVLTEEQLERHVKRLLAFDDDTLREIVIYAKRKIKEKDGCVACIQHYTIVRALANDMILTRANVL